MVGEVIRLGGVTCHANGMKLKWEITWTGGLHHLSGLPHLPGVPHLHVNLLKCPGRWLNFWTLRVGAYSRWALTQGWAQIELSQAVKEMNFLLETRPFDKYKDITFLGGEMVWWRGDWILIMESVWKGVLTLSPWTKYYDDHSKEAFKAVRSQGAIGFQVFLKEEIWKFCRILTLATSGRERVNIIKWS